ncbi:Peptidase inhibitor I9 [Musa troglodytarum]|uniref:Peptidase inhibitor I9 n=1 Tax=Musa troglodytarum TaxID=320322 RepID=A0A9E7F635_9LILI|nr:Peptidase inhibitor I9 [Musa troglodytarum]
MAPHAHLAIYKVCGSQGCSLADVLSGIDAGVKDGADVLSLSLGGSSVSLAEDPLAIGAFGAAEKGSFRASIELGDGHSVNGESLDQSEALSETSLPLYFSQDSPDCGSISGDASGKVVVCKAGQSPADLATLVKDGGGVALIYITDASQGSTKLVRRVEFPAAFVSDKDGASIISYATSTSNPTASISFDGAVLGASAPSVAFFSSRGPSLACPSIIKPDVSGPGVNILGTGESNYNIISGTSMATPHLSGVAALIKSVHPKWSPAAIKSAIITTSDDKVASGKPIRDEQEEPASFFAMGAGHVNPSKAVDPGLIYDLNTDDYIAYICGKFGDSGASVIVRDRSVNCDNVKNITEANLNYPSIFVALESGSSVTVKRTVTNVGAASSSYKVQVNVPKSVSVTVTPHTLTFSKVKEKKSFTVTVKLNGSSSSVEGNLKWISDKHVVRSPIVVSSS